MDHAYHAYIRTHAHSTSSVFSTSFPDAATVATLGTDTLAPLIDVPAYIFVRRDGCWPATGVNSRKFVRGKGGKNGGRHGTVGEGERRWIVNNRRRFKRRSVEEGTLPSLRPSPVYAASEFAKFIPLLASSRDFHDAVQIPCPPSWWIRALKLSLARERNCTPRCPTLSLSFSLYLPLSLLRNG